MNHHEGENWDQEFDHKLRRCIGMYRCLAATVVRELGWDWDDLFQELRIRILLELRKNRVNAADLENMFSTIVHMDLIDLLSTARKKSAIPRVKLKSLSDLIEKEEEELAFEDSVPDPGVDVEREAIITDLKQQLRDALLKRHKGHVVDAFIWCIEHEEKHIPGRMHYKTFYEVRRTAQAFLQQALGECGM